jgi:hypothetical protein
MTPFDVDLRHLIESVDRDAPGGDPLARVRAARQRARSLADIGDQLVDHFVSAARDRGSSWSQIGDALGVSKQAVQQRWVPEVFRRYTDRSRHVVVLAKHQAYAREHDRIGTEHLLLGLMAEEGGLGSTILADRGIAVPAVEEALGAVLDRGAARPGTGRIPFSAAAAYALEEAGRAALDLGHDFIGTEHLLLGLLRVPEGDAARVLGSLGVAEESVRAEVGTRVEALLASRDSAGE